MLIYPSSFAPNMRSVDLVDLDDVRQQEDTTELSPDVFKLYILKVF